MNGGPSGSGSAARSSTLRRHNASAILSEIVRHGPMSRVELSTRLRMSPASVTTIGKILLRQGILTARNEARATHEATGRPRTPLDIAEDGPVMVGAHIDDRANRVVATDLRGVPLATTESPRGERDPKTVLNQTVRDVRRVMRKVGADRVAAVGVSMSGWIDYQTGRLVEEHVFGWRDVAVRAELERSLGLPVEFDSTARAVAQAEALLGTGRGHSDVLTVFFGAAASSCMVVDGRTYRGRRSRAGDIEHFPVPGGDGEPCICGRRDCLQVTATTTGAFARALAEGLVQQGDMMPRLWDLAREGDERAQRIVDKRNQHVADALLAMLDFVDPDLTVVSGIGQEDFDVVMQEVRRRRQLQGASEEDRVVQPTFATARVVAVASAALALDAYLRDPIAFEPALSASTR